MTGARAAADWDRMTATRLGLVAALLVMAGCDDGLTPHPTCPPGFVGVCGRVTFRGALPESTDAVFLVAYATFPESLQALFTFQPPQPLKISRDSTAPSAPRPYQLPLPNGTYHWVLAAWKKLGTLTPASADSLLREAGYYRDPADPTRPGVVVVNGTATTGIDFVVDFTNMHPVSYYFPPLSQRP